MVWLIRHVKCVFISKHAFQGQDTAATRFMGAVNNLSLQTALEEELPPLPRNFVDELLSVIVNGPEFYSDQIVDAKWTD